MREAMSLPDHLDTEKEPIEVKKKQEKIKGIVLTLEQAEKVLLVLGELPTKIGLEPSLILKTAPKGEFTITEN